MNSGLLVETSLDSMSAYVDVLPRPKSEQPLTLEIALGMLEQQGVIMGIDRESLHTAVISVQMQGAPQMHVLVAQGKKAIPACTEKTELEETLFQKKVKINDTDAVDYRERSSFILINSGDRVGRLIPGTDGEEGFDVHGNRLEIPVVKSVRYELGEGLKLEENNIIAAVNGRVVIKKNLIQIQSALYIRGDVDFAVGNIKFPGDVRIGGEIHDGFKVEVGGDLQLDTTTEATEILCNGHLEAKNGIIGGADSRILVGDSANAHFLQNAKIEVLKDLKVLKSIMYSSVFSSASIYLQKNSMVVNSDLCARNDIILYDVGKKNSSASYLTSGVDYVAQRKLAKFQTQKASLEARKKKTPAENKEEWVKLDAEEEAITNGMIDCLSRLDGNGESKIIAYGTLNAGTVLRICSVTLTIDREMKNKCFYIDKNAGRILAKETNQNRRRK